MKPDERRQGIIDLLVEAGTVGLDDLADRFGVSKMTIHRDLDDLETAGVLRKLRGGASIESSLQFESDYRFRERRAMDAKRAIANAAVDLIEPGMTVLVNDGTTASVLAEVLPEKRPLTVITNNRGVIDKLLDAPGITLVALGGQFNRKFNGFFGLLTEDALSRLRADIAFISVPAISDMTCFHMDSEVVRTKRMMMAAARSAVLLTETQKFGRSALHRLADLSQFDVVVTDTPLGTDQVKKLSDAGIRIVVAGELK